jgi:hypothetical protein
MSFSSLLEGTNTGVLTIYTAAQDAATKVRGWVSLI